MIRQLLYVGIQGGFNDRSWPAQLQQPFYQDGSHLSVGAIRKESQPGEVEGALP